MVQRLGIVQSSYIPWKGYFAIIGLVDEFILHDTAQYTKQDWRNRNVIKTDKATAWLTIPVVTKGRSYQAIREVEIAHRGWASKHFTAFRTHYGKARYFRELAPKLEHLYRLASLESSLSAVNELFLRAVCEMLAIRTRITHSSDYELRGDRNERLIYLCQQTGSKEYLTGPNARAYIDQQRFAAHGVTLHWMDYRGFPEYEQLFTPPFVHEVTILDLLLNEGVEGATDYMQRFVTRRRAALFGSVQTGQVFSSERVAGAV